MCDLAILGGLKNFFETIDIISNTSAIRELYQHLLFIYNAFMFLDVPEVDIKEAVGLIELITSHFAYNMSKVKRDANVAVEFNDVEHSFNCVVVLLEEIQKKIHSKDVPDQRQIFRRVMKNITVIKKCIIILKIPPRAVSNLSDFVVFIETFIFTTTR